MILSNLYYDFSREFFIGSFDIVDENYAHDLELELKNKLAGFNLGSFISGCELEAFCYVVADEIVNKSRSEHIVKKNDKSWTIKAEELRKRKEREAEERRKREEEKYLADSVLDLYFSGNLSDESDGCVEIVLTTLNRDGEKIEINLGEYKRVKRKNGSKGFVASELKLDFKPRLLKILKDVFSDYIQESDRMDFCEVVIDELLTQSFSEQVFTRIADETQGETSVDKSNDEDESSYYFGILGLRNDASLQDVEHSYKEMMKFWHPDQFAGNKKKQAEAEEHCKQLNVAYSWLKDYFQA